MKKTNVVSFLLDPLEALLNIIVRIVVYLFIPFPLAAETIVQFRGLVLTILGNGILMIVVFILMLLQLFTNPHFTSSVQAQSLVIDNQSFASTDIPLQNPLGGEGLSLVRITAGFLDPNYTFFGGVHTGIDFIPNKLYYKISDEYKKTGQVPVYATMNGTVRYYIDQYGSHTVEVTNRSNTTRTIFMHLNSVYISTGDTIAAGKAIGTMGNTGFSTGEHLHYELRINQNGVWLPVNPLSYIK